MKITSENLMTSDGLDAMKTISRESADGDDQLEEAEVLSQSRGL
jgi:hypothetical protein